MVRHTAPALQHMHHVGGACGVRTQHLLQIWSADATPYGHGKEVDHLLGVGTKQVRAEEAMTFFLH
jgi:hypothetical protein